VLPLQALQHITELNDRGGHKGRKWHLRHLQELWLAGKCPFKKGDLVLEPSTIMQIWAYANAAIGVEASSRLDDQDGSSSKAGADC
jgi:hypothetical protein